MGRRVRTVSVRGPLASWAAGFRDWLVGRGYLPLAVFHRSCLLAVLSRWLEREGLSEWTAERTELFLVERRAAELSTWVSPRCVALPLVFA